jgi:hypothetical protein
VFSKTAHDKLRLAQALLSHAVPAEDVAQVLERALDALIAQVEKRKFGAGSGERARGPRKSRRDLPSETTPPPRPALSSRPDRKPSRRYVPAQVRRAVWERDQGRCTFVSATGTRCQERRFLEFDHIEPVARGGLAAVEGMRLRCRAHNQYEAERVFGAEFMTEKREDARMVAAKRRA